MIHAYIRQLQKESTKRDNHHQQVQPQSAYIKNLVRLSDEANATSEATAAVKSMPLPIKIEEWWNALSPHERRRPFSMCELVAVFKVAPGRLGIALAELGWSRRRVWTTTNYKRYWVATK